MRLNENSLLLSLRLEYRKAKIQLVSKISIFDCDIE